MSDHSLIIGGTRGLGREVAQLFLNRGDEVSVIGRSPPSVEDCLKPNFYHTEIDVAKSQELASAIESLMKGRGILRNVVILQRFKGDGDKWEGEIATSLTATKNIIENLRPYLSKEGRKSIVLVTSIADTFISAGQPVGYHVAKAGMLHMSKYYAVTLGTSDVCVNTVAPCTFIKQENLAFYEGNKEISNLFNNIIPLRRMGTALDTAKLIDFLCSDGAAFITGQHITVDGGVSLLSQEALARNLVGV